MRPGRGRGGHGGTRRLLPAAALLLALSASARPALAASSATVSIEVEVQAYVSVSVDGLSESTDTVHWNTAVANASFTAVNQASATVMNNSGAVTEIWSLSALTNTENLSDPGGSSWTIAASTIAVGRNEVAVQAVFGSSNTASNGCPANGASDWDGGYAPPLSSTPQQYTSGLFADPNLTGAGQGPSVPDNAQNQIYAGSRRALCWRVIMPLSTSIVDTQVIPVIITAAVPP